MGNIGIWSNCPGKSPGPPTPGGNLHYERELTVSGGIIRSHAETGRVRDGLLPNKNWTSRKVRISWAGQFGIKKKRFTEEQVIGIARQAERRPAARFAGRLGCGSSPFSAGARSMAGAGWGRRSLLSALQAVEEKEIFTGI